jgi:hypothetical protein
MPAEGVVNALRTIHAALAPGGLLVDTQPVSTRPPVVSDAGELGTLDMRDWGRTIDETADRIDATIGDGLFAVEDERSFVVTDSFADGAEMLATVQAWRGTRIPHPLDARVGSQGGPVHVHQDIRLRLLRAL